MLNWEESSYEAETLNSRVSRIIADILVSFPAVLLVMLLLIGPRSEAQETVSLPANTCGEGTEFDFSNWLQWSSVTQGPIRSKGHNNNWVGIYVDELAEETYLSASSPYPTCARIVKPIYIDKSGEEVLKLTIMMKMAQGYDPENADWWYGVYDRSGTKNWKEGKLPECIICHQQASKTDYLFSNEVIHEDKE